MLLPMDPNRRTRLLSIIGIAVVVIVLAVTGVVALRNTFGGMNGAMRSLGESIGEAIGSFSGESETREFDVEEFDSIRVRGGWKLTVRRGSGFSATVTAPSDAFEHLEVDVGGDTLEIGFRQNVAWSSLSGRFEAEITVPALAGLRTEGGADVRLLGISADELKLRSEGAAQITAIESRIENLELDADGGVSVDFTGSWITNADLDIDGAASIRLNMSGGTISGSMDGVGVLRYSGEARREIDVNGLASVEFVESWNRDDE